MRLMLTSFGATIPGGQNLALSWPGDMFYRMPPADMKSFAGEFRPPFHTLLLCDHLTLDTRTYGALLEHRRHRSYDRIADTMRALHSEGLLDLVDYDEILATNANLLSEMTSRDLRQGDEWISAMLDAQGIWKSFADLAPAAASRDAWSPPRTRDWTPRPAPDWTHLAVHGGTDGGDLPGGTSGQAGLPTGDERSTDALLRYLAYVNSNLVLSSAIDAPILDWADFAPFYRGKFRSVGRTDAPGKSLRDASEALFTIAFPEFEIRDPKTLLKVLNDKRIVELRAMIEAASRGEDEVDANFANRVLREIASCEQKLGRYRRLVGYATIPLQILPAVGDVAQLAVQELADFFVGRTLRREYRWFYMLSDITQDSSGSPEHVAW